MLNSLVDLVLQKRALFLFLTVAIVAGGIYSWQSLQIDAFPDATNIQVMILTEAPGLAAVDVEQQITYPIEAHMGGLPDVRQVRSLSKPGLSQVVVVFEDSVDIYFARQIVLERLQAAEETLPDGMEPELGPVSTGLGEIYQYTLESSRHDAMELRTIQDWLVAPRLRTISGVTEVNCFGGFVKQLHVVVEPDKLLKYGLALRDVFEAVEKNNANAGGGFILHGWEQSYVRTVGLFAGADDISRVVLKTKDGTPVFLGDVAEIRPGPETRQGAVTRDGKGEAVCGMVVMLKGANAKEVVDRVRTAMAEIEQPLREEGVTVNTFYDRTALIVTCMKTMTDALWQGGLLVVAVLFLFLMSVRAGLIVAISIPLSALITFIMMRFYGLTANLMSLGGLAV
ncbi:MAG: efflux RND transporter permease subunit, partial [Planctomycetota bacterium]|nr:efflux RND transporter permease subunit [Planctomycetota bacterium]